MNPKNKNPKRYRYAPSEGYESRSQRRMREDLGIDQAAAEAILHLRSQVIELQAYIQQLEAELSLQTTNQQLRLAHYREVYDEAIWIELEFHE